MGTRRGRGYGKNGELAPWSDLATPWTASLLPLLWKLEQELESEEFVRAFVDDVLVWLSGAHRMGVGGAHLSGFWGHQQCAH